MSATEQLFQDLDSISKRMWDISLDNSAFESLKKKVSTLSAQIAVHHTLDNTASQLLDEQGSSTLPIQSRLSKFFDALNATSENLSSTHKLRWEQLRSLDCASFLFIAVSYTPLDISKMHRAEFEYLMVHVPKYIELKKLPERWMFRREIQVALAEKAELENIAEFRMKYYTLEFTDRERIRKRPRLVDAQTADRTIDSVIQHESTEHVSSVASQQPPENGPTSSKSNTEYELNGPQGQQPITALISGNIATLPLTVEGIKVIEEYIKVEYMKGGFGLSINLPAIHEYPPFMILPYHLCVNIMHQHTA